MGPPALSGLGCLKLEGLCEVCGYFLLTFESTDIVCPELCLLGEGDVLGVGGQGGHPHDLQLQYLKDLKGL